MRFVVHKTSPPAAGSCDLCSNVKMFVLIAFVVLAIATASFAQTTINPIDEQPIVLTGLGRIQGSVLRSRLGALFYGFRGIRYGKAPVDDLRFKAPQPVEQWNDVFDATVDGPMCPQPTEDESDISEDCLRLNVYTHNIVENVTRSSVKKPVIVYLHPGGFYAVSGQSKNYAGPQAFMDRDIVLVTFNYRLGTLGMLSTGTKEYPGNAAFKDQVLVLKWIKLHIQHFGGDPNSVTLMGYSAGGLSVSLHMVSPMSRGLFHKAILMSGAATAQWDIPTHQLELVERQARALKCPDDTIENMMECFKNKTGVEFGNSLMQMFEFGQGNPVLMWKPVVEPDFGQERFLTDNPTRLFRQGRFTRVPVMAGITELEFASPAIAILNDPKHLAEMNDKFNEIAPICFQYERNTNRSHEITARLKKEFLNDTAKIDESSLPGLINLFGDGLIGFGVHRFVKLVSPFVRTFYYKNSYVGRYSHLYYPADKPYGAVHHDDLLYFFVGPFIAPMFKVSDPENLQVERMTRMWSSFAYRGDPNKPNDDILKNLRWRPTYPNRMNYLSIGNDELEMKERMFEERFKVWDELFPFSIRRRGKDDEGEGYEVTENVDEGDQHQHSQMVE